MAKQMIVVAYDIPDDKKRTKLHKKLRSYGTPVQYSVFECLLDGKRLEKLRALLDRVTDAQEDLVRVYFLCQTCHGRMEVLNGKITRDDQTLIV